MRRTIQPLLAATIAVVPAFFVAACASDDGNAESDVMGDIDDDMTAVMGRVVDPAGSPLVGVKVLGCTDKTCKIEETDESGEFFLPDVPGRPLKMEAVGAPFGHVTLIWYQPVTPYEINETGRDIVLPELPAETAAFPVESGGVALVAAGQLELSAGPGELVYPLGTEDESIRAIRLEPDALPPYDATPWSGVEAGTLAFVVNPYPLESTVPFGLAVRGVSATAGAVYDIWYAESDTAVLTDAGTATADESGDLVADPGHTLAQATTIIFVPR